MLTIQHTNNTHTVEQQWEFYSALTLIIDIQGRPTVCISVGRRRKDTHYCPIHHHGALHTAASCPLPKTGAWYGSRHPLFIIYAG